MDPFHKFPFGAQLTDPPKIEARWAAGQQIPWFDGSGCTTWWVAFHDEKLSKAPILNDLKWIFFRSIP